MNSLKLAYQLSQEEEKVPIELEKNNSTGIQCDVCGQSIADFNDVIFLDCHMMCKSHLVENIHREYPVKNMATCGMPSCSYQLSVAEIQAIIGEREFEMLKDKTFQQYIGETGGKLVKCQCGQQTLMEPGVVDYNFKDEQGHQLTREAAVHMAENRFRCPACSTIQCAACGAVPYHLGKSCEEFALFQRSEKCRFCDEIIQPGQSSCPKPECQERMKVSCRKILPCGHRCYGVNGEDQCVPCLHPDCAEKHANLINGANENEFCPICYTEGLGASPVVHLQCGHVIHYECVVSALRNRWVGPRITFNFAKWPQCKEWVSCILPNIMSAMRQNVGLHEEIREKAEKRLEFEGMQNDKRPNDPTDIYYKKFDLYAMDRFAYYECFKCKKAYFGGKKECEQNNDGKQYDPSELICPSCSAEGMPNTDCRIHGTDFIEFKCKFCCSIAAWFCWGNTHFWDQCHTRQNNGDYVSRKKKSDLPKWPGKERCPLKVEHLPNGEEQALGWAICRNSVQQDF